MIISTVFYSAFCHTEESLGMTKYLLPNPEILRFAQNDGETITQKANKREWGVWSHSKRSRCLFQDPF